MLVTGTVGLVATITMIYWEMRVPNPVLALEIMKNRIFRMGNLVMTFGMMAFMALLHLVPLLIQAIESASSTRAGLVVFPEAISVMIGSRSAGSLYPRIGPRRLLGGGLAATALAIAAGRGLRRGGRARAALGLYRSRIASAVGCGARVVRS
ncbi:hypothetical protein [Frankia sp. QA3]|uniref:hypothetical protein n=1 Tax=Frankia sp. QA3 TaxID=710111 RepID=UPI00068815A0|nr:hypothetical protein [Frankia sp. QA3]